MKPNTQPIEKRISAPSLQVHSIFYTIQGEGPFTGSRAVFVRLAGCNLQCPGCDTDYTSQRESLSPSEILFKIVEVMRAQDGADFTQQPIVVITGGEPFRQNLEMLFIKLVSAGFCVQVETNGTLPPPNTIFYNKNVSQREGVYIVVSPKTAKIHPNIRSVACAYKYVAQHGGIAGDGLPVEALDHIAAPCVARPSGRVPVYLQPMDEKSIASNNRNQSAVVESCLKHGYTLQLQVHKLIGVE